MNRNTIKANAIRALGETILMASTLTAGLSIYDLFKPVGDEFAVAGAIVLGFATNRILTPILADVFDRLIDRITAAPATPADGDASEPKANA